MLIIACSPLKSNVLERYRVLSQSIAEVSTSTIGVFVIESDEYPFVGDGDNA